VPEPFDIEPEPTLPALPGTVVVRETQDEVVDALAADMLFQALSCVRAFGDFHAALPGGTHPEVLYRRLMTDPPLRRFPWTRTHLWVLRDELSSAGRPTNSDGVTEWLVDHSGIPPAQVHPIPLECADADRLYEKDLTEQLEWREKGQDRLDFVLLTLEDRCGLPEPRAEDTEPLIRASERSIAMSHRLINGARLVAVLACGSQRRASIAAITDQHGTDVPGPVHPLLELQPPGGELRWYVDRAACP